ncbi:hypothetical protein WJX72_007891 [[Myrmecia] bisecta]|uniref:VASt domain-containing protein n=1 Tax=[Myrmecia] bisecta TaxID=41462 RepID=A0AAW1P335_9CHLO
MGQLPMHISLPISLVVSGLLVIQRWHKARRGAEEGAEISPEAEKLLDQVEEAIDNVDLVRGDTEAEESGELSTSGFSVPDPLSVMMLDESYPVGIKKMWRLLFDERSRFVQRMNGLRRNRDVTIGKWVEEGGVWTRNNMYTTPLKKNPLGPREAECQEVCTCTRFEPGFIVEVVCTTPKVPYGSAFYQRLQYCVWREAPGQTHVRISAQVEFTKSVLVRGLIVRASVEGMKETFKLYADTLRQYVTEIQRSTLQSTPRDVELQQNGLLHRELLVVQEKLDDLTAAVLRTQRLKVHL